MACRRLPGIGAPPHCCVVVRHGRIIMRSSDPTYDNRDVSSSSTCHWDHSEPCCVVHIETGRFLVPICTEDQAYAPPMYCSTPTAEHPHPHPHQGACPAVADPCYPPAPLSQLAPDWKDVPEWKAAGACCESCHHGGECEGGVGGCGCGDSSYPSSMCGGHCDSSLGQSTPHQGCRAMNHPSDEYYGFEHGHELHRSAPFPHARQPHPVGYPPALLQHLNSTPSRHMSPARYHRTRFL